MQAFCIDIIMQIYIRFFMDKMFGRRVFKLSNKDSGEFYANRYI